MTRKIRGTSGPSISDAQRKRKRISITLDPGVYAALFSLCEREQLQPSRAIELALREYLGLRGTP